MSLNITKVIAVVGNMASKSAPITNEGNATNNNFPFNFISGSSSLIVSIANLIPVINRTNTKTYEG